MRFSNIILALGGISGALSTFQGVNDRGDLDINDDNANVPLAPTLAAVELDARGKSKSSKKTTAKDSSKTTTTAEVKVTTTASTTSTTSKVTTTTTTSVASSTTTSTSTTTSEDASASACSTKRHLPKMRFMKRSGPLNSSPSKATNGKFTLDEQQWATSMTASAGNTYSVVNVAGCTVVFVWPEDNIPFVFHIFSGQEKTDAATAASTIMDSTKKPVHVYISAENEVKYKAVKDAFQAAFIDFDENTEEDVQLLQDSDYEKVLYDYSEVSGSEFRFQFDSTAGVRSVSKEKVAYCSKEKK